MDRSAPVRGRGRGSAAWKPADGAPKNLEEWEKDIRSVVSSFEVAVRDVRSDIGVDFEVTFNLRETGIPLEWLTMTFRNELQTVDVPEARDIVIKAAFDAANTDEVIIQLLSVFHRGRNPRAHGFGSVQTAVAEYIAVGHAAGRSELTADLGRPDMVELETATGNLIYELPVSLSHDTLSSMQVSEILSPRSTTPNRALANNKRRANRLLGLRVGNQYRYPLFQLDRERKRIRPIAEYANQAMECDLDPWGTLDWWFTENDFIGGERPANRLERGRLSEKDVDLMVEAEQMGMD